jgi:hypothetical protein
MPTFRIGGTVGHNPEAAAERACCTDAIFSPMNMKKQRTRSPLVWLLAGALAFLSASALLGGLALVLDPSGAWLQMSPALLEGTPFRTFLLPGLVLFAVLGLCPLAALWGLARSARWAWLATLLVAGALVVWIAAQVLLVGYASWLQPFYGALGAGMLLLVLVPRVRHAMTHAPA